jgi:hypothetical protein
MAKQLIDSCRRNQPLIICPCFIGLPSTDHKTIVNHMRMTIRRLASHRVPVVNIVSDNARNVVGSLDPDETVNTLGCACHHLALHGPCSVHTVNLALSDLPISMPGFGWFKADVKQLMSL